MSSSSRIILNGVSVIGFSHEKNNIPCQDANAFKSDKNSFILACADGAGSAKLSHLSSKYITRKLVDKIDPSELLKEKKNIKFKLKLIELINASMNELINNEKIKDPKLSKKDFATTLILVIANKERGYIFHVGDGAAVILNTKKVVDNQFKEFILSEPMNGEYANETYFITMDKWEKYLRIKEFNIEFDAIFLMSDGVTAVALDKKSPKFFFFEPLIRWIKNKNKEDQEYMEGIINTLASDKMRSETDDDKTLAFMIKP